MKKAYPTNPVVELLNVQSDKKYPEIKRLLLFTPLTKEQHDSFCGMLTLYLQHHRTNPKRAAMDKELKKLHKFTFEDVIACGDTKMETRQAGSYIQSNKIKINDVERNNYKCFVNHEWREKNNHMNLPYHEDGGCSWNCLMQKLKNPEYGVIFTAPYEDKFKFEINES